MEIKFTSKHTGLNTKYTKNMDVTGVAEDMWQRSDAEELRTTLHVDCALGQTYWTVSRTDTISRGRLHLNGVRVHRGVQALIPAETRLVQQQGGSHTDGEFHTLIHHV